MPVTRLRCEQWSGPVWMYDEYQPGHANSSVRVCQLYRDPETHLFHPAEPGEYFGEIRQERDPETGVDGPYIKPNTPGFKDSGDALAAWRRSRRHEE